VGVVVNSREYDISIKKGKVTRGFMTVMTSGEFRNRINDFAPVISTPGIQLEYAEGRWRPWTISDLRGGLGQEEWKNPAMFYDMTPGLRIYKNRVTLDTRFYNEDATQSATYGVDFKGDHYAIVGKKIRKRKQSTGNWSQVHSSANEFTDIAVHGTKIYACAPGDTTYHSGNGTTWKEVTQLPGKKTVRALLAFRGSLWACTNTALRFSDDPINGPWIPKDQTKPIKIGDERAITQRLTVIGGSIAIGRTDGLYIYEGSGDRADGPVIDFENMAWTGNCKLFTAVDGFLYYNVGDRVKRTDLQGAEFDVTPFISGDTAKELYGFGIPVGGQGYQGHIYVAFDKMENKYPVVLEMPTIDVGGWRKVYEGAKGATMNGAWFSDGADRLFVNDGTTRSQRFQGKRDAPYPDYVRSAHFITSWFTAGDAWSEKAFASILTYVRDLSATERVHLFYRKRGGSWILIEKLTSGHMREVIFDRSTIAVAARRMQLQIFLTRGPDTGKTPVLELPLVPKYMVRPDPIYNQQVIVRLEDNIKTRDRQDVEWSAATLIDFLRDCEAYKLPIEYTDRYEEAWDVMITRTQELRHFPVGDRREFVMIVTMEEV